MTDAIEVAVEHALLARLQNYCATNSLLLAVPNRDFTKPDPTVTRDAKWLRATFLPADTLTLALSTGDNQHYGLFQVDIFYSKNTGEYPVVRLAADIIALFTKGTSITQDGFVVQVIRAPYRGRMRDDVDPAWVIVSVSIPYVSFAPDPA